MDFEDLLNENGDIKPGKKPAAIQHAVKCDLYNELNQLTGLPSDKHISKVTIDYCVTLAIVV